MNTTKDNLRFPLPGKTPFADPDSLGFASVDLRTHCPVPVQGRGHPGSFGHVRRNHIHEGVDLYGVEGDMALTLFSGTVVFCGPFTGPLAGSPWWHNTGAIAIEGKHGVCFHGEIDHLALGIGVGDMVQAGDPLGPLARVLRNDKGRPLHMLHVELYQAGARQSVGVWPLGAKRPPALVDPTRLLLISAGLDPDLAGAAAGAAL